MCAELVLLSQYNAKNSVDCFFFLEQIKYSTIEGAHNTPFATYKNSHIFAMIPFDENENVLIFPHSILKVNLC